MLDDFNRPHEQSTAAEIERVLNDNTISFSRGVYSGQKQTILFCSDDIKFLTSM